MTSQFTQSLGSVPVVAKTTCGSVAELPVELGAGYVSAACIPEGSLQGVVLTQLEHPELQPATTTATIAKATKQLARRPIGKDGLAEGGKNPCAQP
jgi:hypothetical protein